MAKALFTSYVQWKSGVSMGFLLELNVALSFFLGVVHAIEPGHGKTAMWVYMLGDRRSIWHPVIMAASTAVTHTMSLLAIAFLVHASHHLLSHDHDHNHDVSSVLQWVGTSLMMLVGLTMLIRALRSPARSCGCSHHAEHDHDKPTGHCHHHPNHDVVNLVQISTKASSTEIDLSKSNKSQTTTMSSFRLTAMLGIAIGLLPCPTALAAYFSSLSTGSIRSAYLAVIIFGLGILCSLTVVGVLLQWIGRRFAPQFAGRKKLPLGIIQAGTILMIAVVHAVQLMRHAA